jgi:UPF0716 family protein affecting phage T7 exclusion
MTRPRRRTSDDGADVVLRIVLTGLMFCLIEIADYYALGDAIVWWISLILATVIVWGGWFLYLDGGEGY